MNLSKLFPTKHLKAHSKKQRKPKKAKKKKARKHIAPPKMNLSKLFPTKHLKAHSKKQHKRHDSWLGVVSTHDKKRVKHVATRVTVKKKAKRKLSKKKAEKKAEVQVLFLKDVAHQAVKKKDTRSTPR